MMLDILQIAGLLAVVVLVGALVVGVGQWIETELDNWTLARRQRRYAREDAEARARR